MANNDKEQPVKASTGQESIVSAMVVAQAPEPAVAGAAAVETGVRRAESPDGAVSQQSTADRVPEPSDADGGEPQDDAAAAGLGVGIATQSEHAGVRPTSEPEEPKKRSAADAFDDLSNAVYRSLKEIDFLQDFAARVQERLLEGAEAYRLQGLHEGIEGLINVHDTLFRNQDDRELLGRLHRPSNADVLEMVEGELQRLGVHVKQPLPGDKFERSWMHCEQTKKARKKDRPKTVARVLGCAYVWRIANRSEKQLRRAAVEVYSEN